MNEQEANYMKQWDKTNTAELYKYIKPHCLQIIAPMYF